MYTSLIDRPEQSRQMAAVVATNDVEPVAPCTPKNREPKRICAPPMPKKRRSREMMVRNAKRWCCDSSVRRIIRFDGAIEPIEPIEMNMPRMVALPEPINPYWVQPTYSIMMANYLNRFFGVEWARW